MEILKKKYNTPRIVAVEIEPQYLMDLSTNEDESANEGQDEARDRSTNGLFDWN